MQAPCHCQHVPWNLGANAKSFFCSFYWRPDSSYHNKPALGGYQLLLSKIQGTQALIHYIERSTTHSVEYRALNLVDVGSSPMTRVTSYDVIFNESPSSVLSYWAGPWRLHFDVKSPGHILFKLCAEHAELWLILMIKFKRIIKIDVSNWCYQFLIVKGYKPPGYKKFWLTMEAY